MTIGVVRHTAKVWPGKNGGPPTANVVVDAGQYGEIRVYGAVEVLQKLKRGEEVRLRANQGRWELEQSSGAIAGHQQAKPATWRDLGREANDLARVYAGCYRAAKYQMPTDAPNEAIQACASSVWIAVTKRHNFDQQGEIPNDRAPNETSYPTGHAGQGVEHLSPNPGNPMQAGRYEASYGPGLNDRAGHW